MLLGAHVFFVFLAFPVSILYGVLLCIPIFMKKVYPNIFGWLLVGFCVCMGVYLWFLFGGPSIDGYEGRVIAAVAQKVIVYLMIALIPIEAIGSLIVLRKTSQ